MTTTVGYVFQPTDETLINYCLKKKVLGHYSEVYEHIPEVNVYKWEPWDLPELSAVKSDERSVWFFFCRLDYKYSNSRRANRTTKAGYWKATGKDRKVWSKKGTKQEIGIKKTLVFYKGRAPSGLRTNWVIQEYHLTAPDFPNQRAYVLCRLKKRADEGESSHHVPFDYGNISEDIPFLLSNLELPINNGFVDYDFTSALESQMHLEQDQNLLSLNNFCNEGYMNEPIVDQFEEWGRVYVEDCSDTDAESQYGQVVRTSSLFNGHVNSNEYRQMQMVQSSSGILPSSSRDFSVNSFTNIPQINFFELAREEVPRVVPTIFELQDDFSRKAVIRDKGAEGAVPTISELQDDFSRKAVIKDKVGEAAKHGTALDMLKKEKSNVE